jgi:hypothetical protein
MKKILIVILIAAMIPSFAFAKSATIGVRAGINLGTASLDPEPSSTDMKMRVGFMGGFTGDMFFGPKENMGVKLDLLYTQKGWKEEANVGDGKATFKMDEVVVAPFFVYRFPLKKFTPYLQVGPELGFNTTHKMKYEDGHSYDADVNDWESVDFAMNIGGGVTMPVGPGEVVLDLRYNLGLTDMNKAKEGDPSAKLSGVQIMAGYNYKLPMVK